MTHPYPNTFKEISLGPVVVKNRVVFSAHLTNFAEDGLPSDRHVAYYKARAEGGVGLIITEELSTHPTDWPYEKMIHGYAPGVIEGYRKITQAVHRSDTKIFAQINHNGAQGTSRYSRLALWGPSALADPLFRETPREVNEADIDSIVSSYAACAFQAKQGGFDGIELQCSHSSIVRQFLSPLTNRRSDQWGGSLTNRARLMLRIIEATRESIGNEIALGVRLCGDEVATGGLEIDEAVQIAKLAERSGMVDYVNTSIGIATSTLYAIEASMAFPPGYALYIPSAIRQGVDLPVVAVGRFKDPASIEKAIAMGHADMVGVVRGLIADPDFVKKAKSNIATSIKSCLSCNQECVGRMGLNRWLGCIENPRTAKEYLPKKEPVLDSNNALGEITKAFAVNRLSNRSKVLVIGAGPAGLQSAISAFNNGAQVAIVERRDKAGGSLALASKAPYRSELSELTRNQLYELRQNGVVPTFGVTADLSLVNSYAPDLVVVATGSLPTIPWWARGFDTSKDEGLTAVSEVSLVLDGKSNPSGRVLVFDKLGFHQGTSVAELLADRGAEVTIATPQLSVGTDLGITLDLEAWMLRAYKKGIKLETEKVVVGLEGEKITLLTHTTGETVMASFDWVVVANHPLANDSLYFELLGNQVKVVRVGDSLAPRRAVNAIIEGDLVGGLLK
ncbi:MAG: mycofactocin system FadH/OYE family oxidoreductase 2 [Acidimicrobiaceae bacterium]|nr:mycofactocin system FadH/OYE family oxidoreductase 2 [Acidimicrobiaceae bacterium]